MNEFNRESFSEFLTTFLQENSLQPRRFAAAVGCSEATIDRLLKNRTLPSIEMVKQAKLMFHLGFESYSKLSKAQKKKLSDMVGTVGGGAVGVASIPFIISASGTVSGLSAAGITSGLTALGGGTVVAGFMVTAAIPWLGVAIGSIAVRGITLISANQSLKKVDMDKRWEILQNA
jgi:plasmid maintenance system antidote protein VapI